MERKMRSKERRKHYDGSAASSNLSQCSSDYYGSLSSVSSDYSVDRSSRHRQHMNVTGPKLRHSPVASRRGNSPHHDQPTSRRLAENPQKRLAKKSEGNDAPRRRRVSAAPSTGDERRQPERRVVREREKSYIRRPREERPHREGREDRLEERPHREGREDRREERPYGEGREDRLEERPHREGREDRPRSDYTSRSNVSSPHRSPDDRYEYPDDPWRRYLKESNKMRVTEQRQKQQWLEDMWEKQKEQEKQIDEQCRKRIDSAGEIAWFSSMQKQRDEEQERNRRLQKQRLAAEAEWKRRHDRKRHGRAQRRLDGVYVGDLDSRRCSTRTDLTDAMEGGSLYHDPWGGIAKMPETDWTVTGTPPDHRRRYAMRPAVTADAWSCRAWGE